MHLVAYAQLTSDALSSCTYLGLDHMYEGIMVHGTSIAVSK